MTIINNMLYYHPVSDGLIECSMAVPHSKQGGQQSLSQSATHLAAQCCKVPVSCMTGCCLVCYHLYSCLCAPIMGLLWLKQSHAQYFSLSCACLGAGQLAPHCVSCACPVVILSP